MGRNNRTAGNSYERKIVNELKELGFTDAVTTRSESRNMDNRGVDIMGDNLPIYIQCKNSQNTPNIHDLLTSKLLPKSKPVVIFHKKTKKASKNFVVQGEYIYLKKEDFYNMLNDLNNKGECETDSKS